MRKRTNAIVNTVYHPPSPERVQELKTFLKEFKKTGSAPKACEVLGIPVPQISAWRNQYPEFYQKMEDIRFLVDAEIAEQNGSVIRVRAAADGRMITNPELVKDVFLESLSMHGVVGRAVREICPNAPKKLQYHLHLTLLRWRKEDAEFAERWIIAEQMSADIVEEEMFRRGVEGFKEEVYFAGKQVGETTKYDRTLLLSLAGARKPQSFGKYNSSNQSQHIHLHQHNGTDAQDIVATLLDEVVAGRTRKVTPPGMVHLIEQDGNTRTQEADIKSDTE
jgi:hypothetical protein